MSKYTLQAINNLTEAADGNPEFIALKEWTDTPGFQKPALALITSITAAGSSDHTATSFTEHFRCGAVRYWINHSTSKYLLPLQNLFVTQFWEQILRNRQWLSKGSWCSWVGGLISCRKQSSTGSREGWHKGTWHSSLKSKRREFLQHLPQIWGHLLNKKKKNQNLISISV